MAAAASTRASAGASASTMAAASAGPSLLPGGGFDPRAFAAAAAVAASQHQGTIASPQQTALRGVFPSSGALGGGAMGLPPGLAAAFPPGFPFAMFGAMLPGGGGGGFPGVGLGMPPRAGSPLQNFRVKSRKQRPLNVRGIEVWGRDVSGRGDGSKSPPTMRHP